MDWIIEDWEYPDDEIYSLERQKDLEASWQEWERLPAYIKITKNDNKHESSKVRGVDQEVI